jgi:hypothetical protein
VLSKDFVISLTVNADKISVLEVISRPEKILPLFNVAYNKENMTAIIKNKTFGVKYRVGLNEVNYEFIREGILRKNIKIIKFVLLAKKDGVVISIDGDSDLLSQFNEKELVNQTMLIQMEKEAKQKSLISMNIKREEIPELLNSVLAKSSGKTLLVWLSSNDNKYLRLKIKNGELVEKIGEFEDLVVEPITVLIKQVAVTT